MSDIALRYRKRAEQCRRLAIETRDTNERVTLTKMADELELEADLIDVEIERAKRRAR